MKKSNFQFSNPHLVELHYHENSDFKVDPPNSILDVPISIESNEKRSDTSPVADVSLHIQVGSESNDLPFYVSMVMAANFKWDANCYSSEQLDSLLQQNAPALLLTYARPIIANITNSSGFPAYNLPYINFTQEDK